MSLPKLSHQSLFILSLFGATTSRRRELLNRVAASKVALSVAMFQTLVQRLEANGFIRGEYIYSGASSAAPPKREREYALTAKGKNALIQARDFYEKFAV